MKWDMPDPAEFETREAYLIALRQTPGFENKLTTHPLLLRAIAKVAGPRQAEYGDKYDNFGDIGAFWTIYLRLKLKEGEKLTRQDVALMQDLTKTARMMKSPGHVDSRDDKVGYLICFDDVEQREQMMKKGLRGTS